MRRLQWVLAGTAAAFVFTGCSSDSGYVYRGPRLPAAVASAAAPPPADAPVEAPAAEVEAASAAAPVAETPPAPESAPAPAAPAARVLTPIPRTRTTAPAGPITVPAPDRGTAEIELPEDARSPTQIARDRQAFDRCVLNATVRQSENVLGSASPVGPTPEEACAQRLGVQDRNSAPRRR